MAYQTLADRRKQQQAQPAPSLSSLASAVPATPEILSATRGVLPASSFLMDTALPLAGIGIGGSQALKGIKEGNPVRSGLGSAAAGAGAAALLGGPVGWTALGAGLLGGGAGLFGGESQTKVEDDRVKKLAQQGIAGYSPMKGTQKSHGEQVRKDLASDFVGADPSGQWVNNQFLSTNDESKLRPEDIWGYSAFGEKLGNSWMAAPEQSRKDFAQKALDAGAVREHHGTVDIDWSKVDPSQFQTQGPQVTSNKRPEQKDKKPRAIKPRGETPGLADILPEFSVAPTMPEPDDEPGQQELDAVSNYQQMLAKMAAKAKVNLPQYR